MDSPFIGLPYVFLVILHLACSEVRFSDGLELLFFPLESGSFFSQGLPFPLLEFGGSKDYCRKRYQKIKPFGLTISPSKKVLTDGM